MTSALVKNEARTKAKTRLATTTKRPRQRRWEASIIIVGRDRHASEEDDDFGFD